MEERNAQVAERVLGWRAVTDLAELDRLEGASHKRFHRRRIWYDAKDERQACEECGTMPQFWSELEAAWAVWLRLIEQGYFPELHYMGSGDFTPSYSVHLNNPDGDDLDADGVTASVAICEAGLKVSKEKHP